MSLTVIVPTVGRPTLTATLKSCEGADEIIVVADHAKGPVETIPLPANARWVNVQGGDHGYTARTRGIQLATSTHIAFMDDDDRYTTGAIETLQAACCDRPVIFRMDHPQHGVLWREPLLRFGNVGTPMFVVPNDPGRLGEWKAHQPGLPEPGGDFTFLRGCCERMGDPVWREEIVALVDPGPTVTIVTPWWNHHELIEDYRAAVEAVSPEQIIVVDNNSDVPVPLPGVRLTDNLGFSGACNVGLDLATSDITVFLNNDVAMVERGWLRAITKEVRPGVLVGANLRRDPHGDVDGHTLPYLDGWCLAGMTDDLRDLGGWDETFEEPSYFGDNDLSLRARAAGMTLRQARVGLRHKLNQTTGSMDTVPAVSARNYQRFAARARELLGEKVAA